jgi:hypothetical protein
VDVVDNSSERAGDVLRCSVGCRHALGDERGALDGSRATGLDFEGRLSGAAALNTSVRAIANTTDPDFSLLSTSFLTG